MGPRIHSRRFAASVVGFGARFPWEWPVILKFMRWFFGVLLFVVGNGLANSRALSAAEPVAKPAKPVLRITPGQVIVPTDAMRRPWGELISIDLATRTGKFRRDGTNEVMSFTVLPYAELLHHGTFGDLQDFRVGERAIFRLHENAAGEWTWLTYIQSELNFLNGHREYYYVDKIDAEKGRIEFTQANFDKSFVREQGLFLETDKDTRYWKAGRPAKFSDIAVGDKLRTKTHGIGAGKVRMCWEIFLDDESLLKFQTEQKAVHAARMQAEGLPGYVDKLADRQLALTLFQEGGEFERQLKAGQKVRVAPAGVDRKPTTVPVAATVTEAKMAGSLGKVVLTLEADGAAWQVGGVARVWVTP